MPVAVCLAGARAGTVLALVEEMAELTAEVIWGWSAARIWRMMADWSTAGAATTARTGARTAGLGAALAATATSETPARGPVQGPGMFSERNSTAFFSTCLSSL